MRHARPHLQTHSRGENHSAVAGAAYRLGLRLYDERAKVWHDYRKRELGEEIVRALTVAPKGAPAWATDPAQLWNRVEQAEKRKDAQVARDYRIPIPFGISDEKAGSLAEEMARYICDQLHTPVSIGLHRDADVDALGVVKPNDKQGFHAHLYFPTRRLAELTDGEGEGGGVEGSGFGAKLSMLSNKRTSITFVEGLNAKWAELANTYSSAEGLTPDFDHRSYKRMGLDLTPQPTVGRHVAAMERKGIATRKGAELREALAMAKAYSSAHRVVLDAQRARARLDVTREKAKARLVPTPKARPAARSSIFVAMPHQGSLVALVRASAARPATQQERESLERALALFEILERAIAVYKALCMEIERYLRHLQVAKANELEAAFRADEFRRQREEAKARAERWKETHPWQMKMSAFPGFAKATEEHKQIVACVRGHHRRVQELKREAQLQQASVAETKAKLDELTKRRDEAFERMQDSVRALNRTQPELLTRAIQSLPESDQELVRHQLRAPGPTQDAGTSVIEEKKEGQAGATAKPQKPRGLVR